MAFLTNSLFILSCVIFTFCRGQESQRSMPEKRLVEKRLKAPLTVEVSQTECDLKNIPARCLATPLTQQGYSEKESPSVQSASTDRKRFSWTPNTPQSPLFKKIFIWIKESMNKVFGSP